MNLTARKAAKYALLVRDVARANHKPSRHKARNAIHAVALALSYEVPNPRKHCTARRILVEGMK